MEKLAEAHGWKAGAWFNDLAGELLTEARSIHSDMPVTTEAEGGGIGIQTLEVTLEIIRKRLS